MVYNKQNSQKWYQTHKEEAKLKNKRYRDTHKEEIKLSHKNYRETHKKEIKASGKKYYGKYKDKASKNNKTHYNLVKKELIDLLGGKCANPFNLPHPDWCSDPLCLQIDHVYGGGSKDRKKFSNNGTGYFRRIIAEIKAGSKDYQLLCANCNWIKRAKNNEKRMV